MSTFITIRLIKTKTPFSNILVRPMTLKAPIGQDRPYVSIENDWLLGQATLRYACN